MASFHDVPPEILIAMGELLPTLGDLAALAAVDRRMYAVVNPMLYERMARTWGKRGLFWGAAAGQVQTVRNSLEARADPGWHWPAAKRGLRVGRPRRQSDPAARIPDDRVQAPGTPREDEGEDQSETESENESRSDNGHRGVWDDYGVRDRRLPRETGLHPDDPIAERPADWTQFLLSQPYNWTALHIAASRGYDDVASAILDYGAGSPKLLAAEGSHGMCRCPTPKTLLGNERVMGAMNPQWRPLHHAICRRHVSTAKLLLSRGAPVYLDRQVEEGGTGITALHAACQHGLLPLAKFIVQSGRQTKLDETDCAGQTPLVYAFLYRQWDCFNWLLEQGADINHPTRTHSATASMLHDACQRNADFELACRLLDLGLSVDHEKTHDECNPFPTILRKPWEDYVPSAGPGAREAEAENNARQTYGTRLMTRLLERGVPINCVDPESGLTPLALAVRHNVMPAVRILLVAGADVNARGPRDVTPLHEACRLHREQNPELVAELLERGAEVDRRNEHGQTPLYLACESCAVGPKVREIVQLLVARGADPLQRCPYKGTAMTPLLWASQHEKLASFRLLLSRCRRGQLSSDDVARAFQNSVNRIGPIGEDCLRLLLDLDEDDVVVRDPSSLCRLVCARACSPDAVRLLLDRGASCTYVTRKNGGGQTAIMSAVERKLGLDIVERLIDGGADPDFVDPFGRVPLLAAYQGQGGDREPDGYAYGRLLLRRGADAHKLLPPDPNALSPTMVSTPLTRAIRDHGKGESKRAVLAMLEHQPFRDRPGAPWRPTLDAAIRAGNGPALRALVDSGIDTRHLLRAGAGLDPPLLDLLGTIREWMDHGTGRTRIEIVDDWVDAVQVLVEMGARWTARSRRGETAASKAAYLVGRRWTVDHPRVAGISHCIAQRIRVPEGGEGGGAQPDAVVVRPERVDSLYGCDTVDAVGRHLLEERKAAPSPPPPPSNLHVQHHRLPTVHHPLSHSPALDAPRFHVAHA